MSESNVTYFYKSFIKFKLVSLSHICIETPMCKQKRFICTKLLPTFLHNFHFRHDYLALQHPSLRNIQLNNRKSIAKFLRYWCCCLKDSESTINKALRGHRNIGKGKMTMVVMLSSAMSLYIFKNTIRNSFWNYKVQTWHQSL